MPEAQRLKNYCNQCKNDTWHDVVAERHFNDYESENGYLYAEYYQLVQCRGCEQISFRLEEHDLELARYLSLDLDLEPDEVKNNTINVKNFPKKIRYRKIIQEEYTYLIPNLVRSIYYEVVRCLEEGMNILAGLGLRACIEAVCNELNIGRWRLEEKIKLLFELDYISKENERQLHGIRFLGNKAAHEVEVADDVSLEIAFSIVEHLLNSIYILPERAKAYLDVTIDAYESFELLLESHLSNFEVGIEYPLSTLLEKDRRRVQHQLSNFEPQLIQKIQDGLFIKLRLGDEKKNEQGKLTQYYFVESPKEKEIICDDEIPF